MKRRNAVSNLIRSVGNAWTAWRERLAAIAEISACDPAEVDRIASDLRLTPAELRTLATRGPDAAALLYRRLATIGMAPESIDRNVMRDMQRCCSRCGSKSQCASELEQAPIPSHWPSYCPNAEAIEALTTPRCCH